MWNVRSTKSKHIGILVHPYFVSRKLAVEMLKPFDTQLSVSLSGDLTIL